MKIHTLADREFANTLVGVQQQMLEFNQYRTQEKPPRWLCILTSLSSSFFIEFWAHLRYTRVVWISHGSEEKSVSAAHGFQFLLISFSVLHANHIELVGNVSLLLIGCVWTLIAVLPCCICFTFWKCYWFSVN